MVADKTMLERNINYPFYMFPFVAQKIGQCQIRLFSCLSVVFFCLFGLSKFEYKKNVLTPQMLTIENKIRKTSLHSSCIKILHFQFTLSFKIN